MFFRDNDEGKLIYQHISDHSFLGKYATDAPNKDLVILVHLTSVTMDTQANKFLWIVVVP